MFNSFAFLAGAAMLFLMSYDALNRPDATLDKHFGKEWHAASLQMQESATAEQKREVLSTWLETSQRTLSERGAASDAPRDRADMATLQEQLQDYRNHLEGAQGFEQVGEERIGLFARLMFLDPERALAWFLSTGMLLFLVVLKFIAA